MTRPRKGEVWRVRFDPSEGAEISKTRPAVVIGDEDIGVLPLSIVVPVTGWHPSFALQVWKVKLAPDEKTGITKESAADAFQVKSVSHARCVECLGSLPAEVVRDIQASIAICIGVTMADHSSE
jgi:mRNA interferase MazF